MEAIGLAVFEFKKTPIWWHIRSNMNLLCMEAIAHKFTLIW